MVLVDSKRGGVENHCKEVLTDLSRLCWEENHCNLTFICTADGTEIHAHVYLLSQVSSIINQAAAQFYQHHHGHMHVTLDGIDSPTLGTLLEFLYLGGTTMSHKAADNLYVLCEMLAIDIDQSKITVTGETTRSTPHEERPKTAKSTKRPSSSSSSSSPKNKKTSKSVALYCYCRQPSSKDLLGCDFCPEWYHPRCLNISQAEARKLVKQDTWRCPECIKKLEPAKKMKAKGASPGGKIEQLDGENSFRLTPIKTELLSDDEWSSKKEFRVDIQQQEGVHGSSKEFRVDIQPLEKWGEKKGLVQMDKETYRVWHNAETPTPSPPPSPRARSLETKKNLICEEMKEVKDKGEDVVKSKVRIGMEVDGQMCNDDNDKGGSGKKVDVSVLKDAREDMKKMLQNRSRGMHRPVKRERPSFESMLGEIAAKDLEEIKEKRAKMSTSSSNIKGQIGEMKVKIKDREKSSGHHKSRSSESKREKPEENAKSPSPYKRTMQLSSRKSSKKSSAYERDTDMNWDLSSETEEVNRPVEDAKLSPEKETSSTSADYDELFFCYICKSIYVTKGALDNHIKNAH